MAKTKGFGFGRRYQFEGPHECPYPDCDGFIKVDVDNHYGADADGNRGITVYDVFCEKCERDPNDFDEDDWERGKCFELLNKVAGLQQYQLLADNHSTVVEIKAFLEERGQLAEKIN